MPFQTEINDYQAIGVPGDFASLNPYSSVLAGNSALVAPQGGLTVGNFFWVGPTGTTSQSLVPGWQIAFLGRNMQALITEFLQEATMVVPEGFMVTGFNGGDFLANFPGGAAAGDYVFADPNDGTPVANTTNAAPTLGTGTASAGFSGTATLVNASAVVTIVAQTHGIVSPGDVITGTDIPVGTTILNQLTGPAGGPGTYTMSANATATVSSAEAVTTASAVMLVTAVADGSFNEGDIFSGTDVSSGSTVGPQVFPFSGVGSILTGALTTLVITSVSAGRDLLRPGAVLPAIAGLGIAAGTTISTQVSGTPGGVGSYTISAAGTVGAGVPVTTEDSAGGTGLYNISPGSQIFGAGSAAITITVAGTAAATGFRVRGTYQAPQGAAIAPTGVWKISAPVGNAT
jgi:hypothetical protein